MSISEIASVTERQVEEVSKLMAKFMRGKVPTEVMHAHFINLKLLKKQHSDRLEVFESLYHWKLAVDYSIEQVFLNGEKIKLTVYNTVDIATLADSPGTVFTDKYLVCRTVSPTLKMFAVHVVVQDFKENGARLVLSGMPTLYPYSPNLIPIGTILVVKNPIFHFTADTDIGYSILVTNPEWIFYLPEIEFAKLLPRQQVCCENCRVCVAGTGCCKWDEHNIPNFLRQYKLSLNVLPAPKLPREWKKLGDRLMDRLDYSTAVQAYTKGLDVAAKDMKLLLGRCLCFQLLRAFKQALGDAEKIISLEPKNSTGINYKGKSLIGLGRYQDAANYLKAKLKEVNTQDISETLDEANELCEQKKKGQYNMAKIMKNMGRRIDLAEYTGPLHFRRNTNGQIEGVLVTKNVARGTLLLVQKALVSCVGDDCSNWPTGQLTLTELLSRAIMLHNAEYLLTQQPELVKDFYSVLQDPDFPNDSVLDMDRVSEVIYRKAFVGLHMPRFHPYCSLRNTGIFPGLPSSLRHSCVDANSGWHIFGDYLFLRAFRDIKQGEEVLITLVDPKHAYAVRLKKFADYGITCACRLCKLDKADGPELQTQREDCMRALVGVMKTTYTNIDLLRVQIQEIEKFLIILRSLRMDHPDLNTRIFSVADQIARLYFGVGDVPKCMAFMLQVLPMLRATGCFWDYVGCIHGIGSCLDYLGERKKLQEFEKLLEKELKLSMGGTGPDMMEFFMVHKVLKSFSVDKGF